MRILEITREHANDFTAVMVCEHCGAKWTNTAGYHDAFYHTRVVPAMACLVCGLKRDGTPGTPPGYPAVGD